MNTQHNPEEYADLGAWFAATVECDVTERLFLTEQLVYELTKTVAQEELDDAIHRVFGIRDELDAHSRDVVEGTVPDALSQRPPWRCGPGRACLVRRRLDRIAFGATDAPE